MDNTLKTVIGYFADDYILENNLYYNPDKQLIKNSYSEIFGYCHDEDTKNLDVKEFTDKALEHIPGFTFGTFIKSMQIADNSTIEYVEYYKSKEEEKSDKLPSDKQKKSNNKKLEQQAEKVACNINGADNSEQQVVGNQDNSAEQEANIMEKLAENEIENIADELINGADDNDSDTNNGQQSGTQPGKWASKKTGDKNPRDIAVILQQLIFNLKTLHRTLKNVSAISTSILNGIEKVETGEGMIGYQYGRDLRNIDARDLSLLASSATKHLFKLKYAKGELLQETAIEGKSIGDLIIAIDTSGSVTSEVYCEKYQKTGTQVLDLEFAIAVGMMRFAIKNKAKCKVILFESDAYYTSEWIRNEPELKKFLHTSLVQKLKKGGTSFEDALRKITSEMQTLHHVKNKPGIVFITDGYDSISPVTSDAFMLLKKQLKAKMYSYFVSNSNPLSYCPSLTGISDSAFFIDHSLDVDAQMSSFTAIKK
jgi:uncharacterized protein with von Willebrand factor type A (vWA) domain